MDAVEIERVGNVGLVRIGAATGRWAKAGNFANLENDEAIQSVIFAIDGAARMPEGVADEIARLAKPVVALVDGTVSGNAAEAALMADWRIAGPDAAFALSDVAVGLPPRAGISTVLPRLIGGSGALDLLLSGRVVGARDALALGLIDEIAEDDPVRAALSFASRASRRRDDRGATGKEAAATYLAAIRDARKSVAGSRNPSESRIIDCVEAALLLPFDEAMAYARTAREECEDTAQSRALHHMAAAEQHALRGGGVELASARAVKRLGIVGGGTLGTDLALAAASSGLPVVLAEQDEDRRDKAASRIETVLFGDLRAGRISEDEVVARLALVSPGTGLDVLSGCDMVVEAVVDDLPLKRKLWSALERLCPGAILATTTTRFDANQIASAVSRPDRVLGIHFYPSVRDGLGMEVIAVRDTARWVEASAITFGQRLGKLPIRAGSTRSMIGVRMWDAYQSAAEFLLACGATPPGIDASMRAFGFAVGPFEAADSAGLNSGRPVRSSGAPESFAERLCAAGRSGRGSGAGYYRYENGRRADEFDHDLEARLRDWREAVGVRQRELDEGEIQLRLLSAMANEGARLVERGIAMRPADMDLIMVNVQGFPRTVGGPMQWADEFGPLLLRDVLRRWSNDHPTLWKPSPVLDELIKNGQRFDQVA